MDRAQGSAAGERLSHRYTGEVSKTKPFVLQVRDIVRKPGYSREFELTNSFGENVGEGVAAITAGRDVVIRGLLESVHEGILATGTATTVADAECSRCLDMTTLDVEVDFTELFAYDRSEDSEMFVVGDSIDIEQIVRDAVVLALPFQPVCRPDCAGLDPETGEKLVPGTARKPQERIDPRWAALQEFQAQEDVPADSAGDATKE